MPKLHLLLGFLLLTMLSSCGPAPAEEDANESMSLRCGEEEQEAQARCTSEWPTWTLEDVQPESPRFGETYGLDAFDGQIVLVANLVGWCPYCQAQTEKLAQMHGELEAAGHDIAFVVVHGASANNAEDQLALTSRCSFPILQDTEEANVWGQGQGGKDDFFIYSRRGELLDYLPPSSGTNLNKPEEYEALSARLVEVSEDAE